MARIALCAVVLLGGSLYPVLRPQPWRLASERQAIMDIARKHSKLHLMKLEKLDPQQMAAACRRIDYGNPPKSEWGLLLEIKFHADDVRSLTSLRRELKSHPLLAKSFALIISLPCVWRIEEPGEDPAIVEAELLFVPEGR